MARKTTGGKPPKPPKPPKSPKRPKASRRASDEEIIEPEDIEPVEGHVEDHPEGEDFDVEVEVEVDMDDEGSGRRSYEFRTEGLFGPEGVFGERGPFGPNGPFGAQGPFGANGPFGPGGLFGNKGARKAENRRRAAAFHRDAQELHGITPRKRRRMFGPGELRLVLLAMLAEEARHGYELIKALEEMTAGAYSPSPGIIYPTLQMLADEGVIAAKDSDDARKLYQATDAGIEELEDRADEIAELWERLGRKAERTKSNASASSDIFRALGNLASVITNKASKGGMSGMNKDKVVDLIDELARRIEKL